MERELSDFDRTEQNDMNVRTVRKLQRDLAVQLDRAVLQRGGRAGAAEKGLAGKVKGKNKGGAKPEKERRLNEREVQKGEIQPEL